MTFDPLIIVMVVVLGLFIFMQFRSTKKRRAQQEELNAKMIPGAEVMTQFGVYGTVLSIDDETNEALIETTPGTILRIHRQAIGNVVEKKTDEAEESHSIDPAELEEEPEFGQRDGDGTKPKGNASSASDD